MDYSKFVSAVQNDDRKELNAQSTVLTKVLIKFLCVRMNATYEDAEDCAQNTLMLVIQKIKEQKINNPDSIIYYLFTTAKNDYLKVVDKKRIYTYDEVPQSHSQKADQLNNLLDEERNTILQYCLSKLKSDHYDYISYWFKKPDSSAQKVADFFKISVNNAWTKKHRIIKLLNECVQRKINT